MKMKKQFTNRILSFVLALVMVLVILPMSSLTAFAADSGACGEGLTWTLSSDGTFNISGNGEMTNFDLQTDGPWLDEKENIIKVIAEEGVTRIGSYSFLSCTNLKEVIIKGDAELSTSAFHMCRELTSFEYGGTVTDIKDSAFISCEKLSSFTMREGVGKSSNAFGNCDVLKKDNVKLVDANGSDKTSFYTISLTTGSISSNYMTIRGNLEKGSIEDIVPQTYTGSAIEPAIIVNWNGQTVSSENYDVTYSNNTQPGMATVTVTGKEDMYYTGTVTRTFTILESVYVTGIALQESEAKINVGSSKDIFASVSPDNATVKALDWSVADNSIVSVAPSSDGTRCTVTGLQPGTTTLTAKAKDGSGVSVSCDVTVSYLPSPGFDKDNIQGYTYRAQGDVFWFQGDATAELIPPAGYTISKNQTSNFALSVSLGESETKTVYLRRNSDGAMTGALDLSGQLKFDSNAPMGKITVSERNIWQALINKITFGLFFKGDKAATVTAIDTDSGVKSVEYYLADKDLIDDATLTNTAAISALENAIGVNWNNYNNNEIALNDNAKNVIYVKITDNVGNITYISSDGIVLDSIAPALYGIEDGGVYYGDKLFKAMDDNFLKIEVDGVDITDTTAGDDEFEILADNAEHTVTVTDKAGNVTEYKITVYKNYMVTFTDGDGGSYEKEFKYGEAITIPTNEFFEDTFRKAGYTLTGWQGYTDGMTMPLSNLTFTAVYTPNRYTVAFDANGGAAIDPIDVIFGEKYGNLPSSAITGLSGGNKNWYLVDENGNVTDINIKNLTKVSTARDHKLFIRRNVLAPSVSVALTVPGGISDGYQYYIPGASQRVLTATVGNMNTDILAYSYQWYKDGVLIEGATTSVLTLDGNVSDSGTYKVEVTATLKDGTNIVVTSDSATGSKEQKVKILHATNTLSYDANGGEGGPQSSYTGGTSLNVSKDVPTREHYDFIGWNTAPDGTGDGYKAEDACTFANDGGNGGCVVTLYAQWKPKAYTVTFTADGQPVSTERVVYGKEATLPAVPGKDGYVGKWDSDGKNIAGDTTISAVYTAIPVVNPDEVKPEDKADLADTKAKLEEELKDDSYIEDDKKKIQDAIDAIDDALEVIGNVEEVEGLIEMLPDTIKKDDEAGIKAADDAYNALSDYEKSLVDDDAKRALDDAKEALAELNKPVDPNSPQTGDNSNMFLWIALLFVSGTGIFGITLYDRKRKATNKR